MEPLVARSEFLMGTVAEVRIYSADPRTDLTNALERCFSELRALDRLMAVQRPNSDVSKANRLAGAGPVTVDRRVIEVLASAQQMNRLTDGAFDITVLPAVRAWGFLGDGPVLAPRAARAAEPMVAGMHTVRLDRNLHTVRFTSATTQIDLGGIAKGYALDRARTLLAAQGVHTAYLDLGGNIATLGRPSGGENWRIGIRHPRHPERLLGVLRTGEIAVSTSSDAERFVERDGRRFGHVIDPRTGAPAEGLISATVLADSAMTADALSTAAVVLGAARAETVLGRVGAQGVFGLLDADGTISIRHTAGAPLLH